MFSISSARKAVFLLAGCAALLSPATAGTRGGVTSPLTLLNDWVGGPFGTASPSVEAINGIVHFKGAMSQPGANAEPFVLPAQFRPPSRVYVPIDACHATNARLDISTAGDVSVETEGSFDRAKCLISLDSATFALSTDGFKPVKLLHGWHQYTGGTGNAAVQLIDGMVHFQGAIATGRNNDNAFFMPKALRPLETAYAKADLCDATNGRLEIDPDGLVRVEVEKKFANAKCFTSLDGVSYALKTTGFTDLTLINGWGNYFGDRPAAVHAVNGVVQLEGALETSDTNPNPFVLPASFRPSTTVYVPVDLCDAANGRLVISPNGNVVVEVEHDFSSAQCFTSLEGVSFVQ